MLNQAIQTLKELKYKNGLFAAAGKEVKTGYNKAWLRDNIYATLDLEKYDRKTAVKTIHAILDILLKHEQKINWMIKQPIPKLGWRYIHARYNPKTMEEIKEEWGNKQNDAIGAILFRIGQLERKGIKTIRNKNDLRIIQKLVYYLESIEYWHDADNGMWEEAEEIHTSSIGACVAGLKAIKNIVNVHSGLIEKGQAMLNALLPRESITKETDLALLSLIYPYNIVNEEQKKQILKNIKYNLVRNKGVIRYAGDKYYNKTEAEGSEAEWTMGLAWLAIIYKQMNAPEKYAFYLRKTIEAMNEKGELPELYYSNTEEHNENTPLAWSQNLFIAALE